MNMLNGIWCNYEIGYIGLWWIEKGSYRNIVS